MSPISLAKEEFAPCIIYSRRPWNNTGVYLEKGSIYSFEASGKWTDFFINTDANGFSKWILNWREHKRKLPEANWFALIGTYNQEHPFLIGSRLERFEAKYSGELVCYANDDEKFYWNNFGFITLNIKKIS